MDIKQRFTNGFVLRHPFVCVGVSVLLAGYSSLALAGKVPGPVALGAVLMLLSCVSFMFVIVATTYELRRFNAASGMRGILSPSAVYWILYGAVLAASVSYANAHYPKPTLLQVLLVGSADLQILLLPSYITLLHIRLRQRGAGNK